MARPARPERSRSALPLRQLSRFCYLINSDMVFGTHTGCHGTTVVLIVPGFGQKTVRVGNPCRAQWRSASGRQQIFDGHLIGGVEALGCSQSLTVSSNA